MKQYTRNQYPPTILLTDTGPVQYPGNIHPYPHMTYKKGLTPEEQETLGITVGGKMVTEDDNYTEKPVIRKDYPYASDLECRAAFMMIRLGMEVIPHPEKNVNLGHGLIYSPDALCIARNEYGMEFPFYIEPHAVANEILKGDKKARTAAWAELKGCPVVIFKPNGRFQLMTRGQFGILDLQEEADSVLCYCPDCNAWHFRYAMDTKPCPMCASHRYKLAFFGDSSKSGCIAINPNYSYTWLEFWMDTSEDKCTTPVQGEFNSQIVLRDELYK